jgi:leader peptidase (prepilin peptidase)/N-methyltransferase
MVVIVVGVALCVGAVVGSFLNVCVYRVPRQGLSIWSPARSFCPSCGAGIVWYDNVPVLSWLALGGRCRSCRAPISLRYLVVEALTAVVFALVAHRIVVELGVSLSSIAALSVLLAFVCALIVGAFVDIDLRIIPDEVTVGGMHVLPLAMLALPELRLSGAAGDESSVCRLLDALARAAEPVSAALPPGLRAPPAALAVVAIAALAFFALGVLAYGFYRKRRFSDAPRRLRDTSLAGVLAAASGGLVVAVVLRPQWSLAPPVYSLAACLLGMLAGSTLILVVGVVGSRVFRKPAMGFGDVKLMGLLGGLTGWSGALVGFLAASILGALYGVVRFAVSRDHYLAFGPFLTIACLVVYLWPGAFPSLVEWYFGLLGG